jgi:CubicO group peptidase (beta-lactamase class C family)
MGLSSEAVSKLQSTFDDACADRDKGLPGVVGVAVGRDGKELFAHAAGKRGFGSEEPMSVDNIFWIASCTKMITGVACMQLVEQEKLALDDAAQTEKLCPELKDLQVLQPDGKLVPKKGGITLRMLLTHTCKSSFLFAAGLLVTGHQPDSVIPSSTMDFVTTASRSVMMSFPDI